MFETDVETFVENELTRGIRIDPDNAITAVMPHKSIVTPYLYYILELCR
jgi:hypothetical protein